MSLRLEPLGPEHLPGLEDLIADPEVLRYTLIPEPPPDGFARTWLQRYVDGRRTGERLGFAALDDAGTFVGVGLLVTIDEEGGETEIGYMVVPGQRGRGHATAILRATTDLALGELALQRATLRIDVANAPSQRVAARAGYVIEGVMRSVAFKAGRRGDVQLWSRLPGDPAPASAP